MIMDHSHRLGAMVQMQLADLPDSLRLREGDMLRILENTEGNIFDVSACSVWNGYVTHTRTNASYVNFWFRRRKVALQRLLYANFVGYLSDDTYLKCVCVNKGRCCTVSHYVKCRDLPDRCGSPSMTAAHERCTLDFD